MATGTPGCSRASSSFFRTRIQTGRPPRPSASRSATSRSSSCWPRSSQPPVNVPAEFVVDAAVGEWQRLLGDTSTNPELSWEYWNGKGWWGLDVTLDETLNLKATGAVRFEVPADIASSDWAGKTNHWIRARLIGGDYGREKSHGQDEDRRRVTRADDRALDGGHSRALGRQAAHLLQRLRPASSRRSCWRRTADRLRDQSDANRTGGRDRRGVRAACIDARPTVESQPAPADAADECPPECECHGRAAPPPACNTGGDVAVGGAARGSRSRRDARS